MGINISEFFDRQLQVWDTARNNFEALKNVKVKEFNVDGTTIKVQFNPGRIVSSAAKVDAKSLKERKCFLCAANRPAVQEGIALGVDLVEVDVYLSRDGVPVIALATQKQVYEKTISNAKETRSRGARVLLFTTKDAEVPEGVATEVIRLDEYDDILMPLQLIVPLQLFAYYMAVLRGCDVDKPRNLAKSVTVE